MGRLWLIVVCLLWSAPAWAVTYYVDFVGGSDLNTGLSTSVPFKHIKGMTGCANVCNVTTPGNGDVVIFKGGVTWTSGSFPWNIYGGSVSASSVVYTTDHSWFTGGSFTQPVLDYNSTSTAYTAPMLTNAGNGFFTLDDLKIYRCGPNLTQHDGACAFFNDITDITIQNSTIEGYGGRTCFMIFSGASKKNYNFINNDISHCAAFTWIAGTANGVKFTTVNYVNNLLHDGGSQLGARGVNEGNHGDGFLHYFNSASLTNATSYIDGLTICNNKIYGDWTPLIGYGNGEDMSGFIYIEGAIKNSLVCNNEATLTPPQKLSGANLNIWGDGWLSLRSYGNTAATNVWVVGNTFALPATSASNGGWIYTDHGWTSLFVYNNIFSASEACTRKAAGTTPTGTSDYNEYRCANQGFSGGWMPDGGHSIFGSGGSAAPNSNPLWTSEFTDLSLTASSPGVGAGLNLSGAGLSTYQMALLDADRNGNARGATWDMGAYQFDGTPPGTRDAQFRRRFVH